MIAWAPACTTDPPTEEPPRPKLDRDWDVRCCNWVHVYGESGGRNFIFYAGLPESDLGTVGHLSYSMAISESTSFTYFDEDGGSGCTDVAVERDEGPVWHATSGLVSIELDYEGEYVGNECTGGSPNYAYDGTLSLAEVVLTDGSDEVEGEPFSVELGGAGYDPCPP